MLSCPVPKRQADAYFESLLVNPEDHKWILINGSNPLLIFDNSKPIAHGERILAQVNNTIFDLYSCNKGCYMVIYKGFMKTIKINSNFFEFMWPG